MAANNNKRRVQAINTRGRKRPPAPQAAETTDGKPPGLQSVKRNEN